MAGMTVEGRRSSLVEAGTGAVKLKNRRHSRESFMLNT